MKNIYIPTVALFLFSCSAAIRYTGSQFPQTKQVDVFVTESSIERPFTYMGKGYLTIGYVNPEEVQRKSIQIAKEKGADAILLYDYVNPGTGDYLKSSFRSDSLGGSLITRGKTSVETTSSQGFAIYFIKYK